MDSLFCSQNILEMKIGEVFLRLMMNKNQYPCRHIKIELTFILEHSKHLYIFLDRIICISFISSHSYSSVLIVSGRLDSFDHSTNRSQMKKLLLVETPRETRKKKI